MGIEANAITINEILGSGFLPSLESTVETETPRDLPATDAPSMTVNRYIQELSYSCLNEYRSIIEKKVEKTMQLPDDNMQFRIGAQIGMIIRYWMGEKDKEREISHDQAANEWLGNMEYGSVGTPRLKFNEGYDKARERGEVRDTYKREITLWHAKCMEDWMIKGICAENNIKYRRLNDNARLRDAVVLEIYKKLDF